MSLYKPSKMIGNNKKHLLTIYSGHFPYITNL
jgi:hypothetical protein